MSCAQGTNQPEEHTEGFGKYRGEKAVTCIISFSHSVFYSVSERKQCTCMWPIIANRPTDNVTCTEHQLA